MSTASQDDAVELTPKLPDLQVTHGPAGSTRSKIEKETLGGDGESSNGLIRLEE